VKFSKNWTPPHNSLTTNITFNEGLIMPCVNCTMMGFATNSVLTLSHFAIYIFMNKLVIPKSKRQPTISLFILQFNFNKLKTSFLWALILATKLLGKLTYLGKCNHLPKVGWCSSSLGVHCCCNWIIWPWIGFVSPS